MTKLVVDTDVLSYYFKNDTRAALYDRHLLNARLHVSFATVAELYRWAKKAGWGARRTAELHQALSHYSVLPFDDELAWKWAEVMTIPGVPIAHGDAWIASTAIRHGMPLVTHNRKHFEKIPRLTIISEA